MTTEDKSSKPFELSGKYWTIGCVIVTAAATFLRFRQLTLKPMHHDEGVNGFFLTTLFREGVYKYDPANYHGPDLYYFSLAFTKIFGLNTFNVRASVAIFGVLTVILTLYLWRYIGRIGALTAAMLLALSPGMVYVSRYFIHEILFVFFSLAIVACVLFFIEKRRAGPVSVAAMSLLLLVCFLPTVLHVSNLVEGKNIMLFWALRISLFAIEAILVFYIMRLLLSWNSGQPVYLILASASAALLFATKETAFITLGTMIIAIFCVWIWRKIYRVPDDVNPDEFIELTWSKFRPRIGTLTDVYLMIAAVSFIFIYVLLVFFSSFFTYPKGVPAFFEAYAVWTKTGSKDHTQNGWIAYLKWGYQLELPLFLLSAVGTLIAFAKGKQRFAMFASLWALGLFLAYTIIPYKTPWLALSFLLPMCIAGGYAVNEIAVRRGTHFKLIAAALAALSFGFLGYKTYELNFVRYDDDSMAYVYAHTKRGFHDLIKQIEHFAAKSGKGENVSVRVISPEYWAMPWYTRDYKNVVYTGAFEDINSAEMIVASEKQKDELNERYGAHYKYQGMYPLRPGVDLILLVKKDLADPGAKDLYVLDDPDFIP